MLEIRCLGGKLEGHESRERQQDDRTQIQSKMDLSRQSFGRRETGHTIPATWLLSCSRV